MPTIGQQITFETPAYIVGHKNFPIIQANMAGGSLSNYDITYAIDTGSGYSSFKNLNYRRAGGGGSSGSTNVTMTSTTGVAVGDYVFGTSIAPNAKVVSITNSTTVVVDIANTGTVSGTLTFNQLPNEPDLPSSGFKMKIRVLTNTTNSTAITNLTTYSFSDSTTRSQALYTLDPVLVKVTAKSATTLAAISDARVIVEAETGGPLPSSASVTITRSGSVATVSHSAHGISDGTQVIIRGANQDEYNGIFTITNVTTDSYDYTVSGTPATPATGSINATVLILTGVTNASGVVETSQFSYTSDQPVRGKVRKSSASPHYRTGTIVGTIGSTGLDTTVLLVSDE
jgi:hypothetical protein